MNKLLNQRGFMEAPAFVLLLLLSILLTVHALVWQIRLQKIRAHHQQVLCLKSALGITTRLVLQMARLNQMLAAGKVGQSIGLFFPGTGWLMALKWEKAKKAIMAIQETLWLKAQQELFTDRREGCRLPLSIHFTPYLHHIRLERKKDLVQLRHQKEMWIVNTPLMNFKVVWQLQSPLTTKIQWEIQ